MFEQIDTVELPTYAICYLANDDSSALNDQDLEIIHEWLAEFTEHHSLTFDYSDEEPSFTSRPEFGLACDTITTTIWGHTNEN